MGKCILANILWQKFRLLTNISTCKDVFCQNFAIFLFDFGQNFLTKFQFRLQILKIANLQLWTLASKDNNRKSDWSKTQESEHCWSYHFIWVRTVSHEPRRVNCGSFKQQLLWNLIFSLNFSRFSARISSKSAAIMGVKSSRIMSEMMESSVGMNLARYSSSSDLKLSTAARISSERNCSKNARALIRVYNILPYAGVKSYILDLLTKISIFG